MGKKKKYKKLKNKVAKLERDLMIVCIHPTSVSAMVIIQQWKLGGNIENALMAGTMENTPEK